MLPPIDYQLKRPFGSPTRFQLRSSTRDSLGAYDLIKRGKLSADGIVTHVFPLDDIVEAFQTQMNARESIRVMIEP